MAYYSGSANDMAAVRSALVNACVAEGWAWNSSTEVLSKGAMFLRLQVVSGFLRLTGRTSANSGDAPHVTQIGPWTGWRDNPLPTLSWPVVYHLFVFEQEVYCVINYSVDCYQWCAFGKSTVQELAGTGMWFGGSAATAKESYTEGVFIRSDGGGESYGAGCVTPAIFWRRGAGSAAESLVHTDLDGTGWSWGTSYSANAVGMAPLIPLMTISPNNWNSEAVLLPIRAYKTRLENKLSLVADLVNSRYLRIDNYSPGQVIHLGEDRWKVFPFLRKNDIQRDGTGGWRGVHSGTLGWAIRYEGL